MRGGDRLPWTGTNYAALQSLDWQVHVYGRHSEELAPTGVPTHEFSWDSTADRAGLKEGAAYLIRPDGYVALAGADTRAIETATGTPPPPQSTMAW